MYLNHGLCLKRVQEANDRSINKYSNAWAGSQCQSQSYSSDSLENKGAVRSETTCTYYIDNAGR